MSELRRLCAVCFVLVLSISGMTEPVRVLVPERLKADLEELERTVQDLELVFASGVEDAKDKVHDFHGAVGWPVPEVFRAGEELRWLQTMSAGVDHIVFEPVLQERSITLTNAQIIMGPEIADHAMALLLGLTRNLEHHIRMEKEQRWDRTGGMPNIELRGKTMLILGLGGIGTQLAERAHAFGMTVLATDPKDKPFINSVEYVGKPDELHDLLPRADVVASCVPRTPKTERLLGEREFELMKNGVYVINVSRGAVIDMDALVAALREGKVAGAGLDVTEPEPLPEGHLLWTMPNVILTPHTAGLSEGMERRRIELIRENIRRFAQDKPLRNVVNVSKGY